MTMEPPLANRLELAIAMLTCLMANANRDPKQRPRGFEVKDFLMDWDAAIRGELQGQVEEGLTPEQILEAFDGLIVIQERKARMGDKAD